MRKIRGKLFHRWWKESRREPMSIFIQRPKPRNS